MGDQHYQYTVLPFGLSSVPWLFITCTITITAKFGKKGIHITPYLDNWLLKGKPREEALSHVQFTLCLLNCLGLMNFNIGPNSKNRVNWDPDWQYELNSIFDCPPIPGNLISLSGTVVSPTAWGCLMLLGHMAAWTQVVKFAWLCLCPLQMWLNSFYSPNQHPLDSAVQLLPPILDSLRWWMVQDNVCQILKLLLLLPVLHQCHPIYFSIVTPELPEVKVRGELSIVSIFVCIKLRSVMFIAAYLLQRCTVKCNQRISYLCNCL